MRSLGLRRRAGKHAPEAAISDIAIRMTPTGARARPAPTRAALLGSAWLGALAVLAPSAAQAVDGTWTGPGAEWTTGTNWTSIPPNTVPDDTATFVNNGAPTSVTISNNAAINTIELDAAAPAYSFTVQNGATFTINAGITNNSMFGPAFNVNTGAGLTIGDGVLAEIGSLAGGGSVVIGPSDGSTLLLISGNNATTFSGTITGAGSLEIDNDASLTLTGMGSVIGGDLELCNCDTGGLTIDGGSLVVNGLSMGVTVFGGTLAVTNGGTLQTGLDLLVAGNMIVTGAGSSVTVNGFTGVGIFGPGALTISNGGTLNSQGGAEIDSIFGTPTVIVTGPGSTWNVEGFGLSVGGGTTSGPGTLTISNGAVVNTNVTFIGDAADGSSTVLVTGAGSTLTATVRRAHRGRLSLRDVVWRDCALCRDPGAELPHAELQRDRRQQRRLCARLQRAHRHRHQKRARRALRPPHRAPSRCRTLAARPARLGARLGERSDARGGVPDASGRELPRQRRDPRQGLRARLRRRGAAPRQRCHAARQVRWRIRLPLLHLCRHRHRAILVVTCGR